MSSISARAAGSRNTFTKLTRVMRNPSWTCRLSCALAVELGVSEPYLLRVRQPVRTHGPRESAASAPATDPSCSTGRSIDVRRRRSGRPPTAELETRRDPCRYSIRSGAILDSGSVDRHDTERTRGTGTRSAAPWPVAPHRVGGRRERGIDRSRNLLHQRPGPVVWTRAPGNGECVGNTVAWSRVANHGQPGCTRIKRRALRELVGMLAVVLFRARRISRSR